MMRWGFLTTLVSLAALSQAPDRFDKRIPWQGRGVWLKADTHVHSMFSDGSATVGELATKAEQFGCDVLAITDHIDAKLKGATPGYFDAIDAARRTHPRLVIIGGAEWNVPPWGGDEHAVVLPPIETERRLEEFKRRFDDLGRPSHDASLADEGLRWLKANLSTATVSPVVTYEHPSRRDARSIENVADIQRWRKINDLVIGFSGAPGHQRYVPTGGYKYGEAPIDRWDPAVARIGDAWDTLLGSGLDVWAAAAPSDFHNDNPKDLHDFRPCEFSATWIYARDRSTDAVLQALRAGSYFGVHGDIVREVEIRVGTAALPRPATAGELVHVRAGTRVDIALTWVASNLGWDGSPSQVDLAEVIGVTRTGARVLASERPVNGRQGVQMAITIPPGGLVVRARGFRLLPDGSRFAFYTNPVRLITR